ncbi:MAG: neutral zinc metallopeptidase, partial [Bryobacteraceae bacterium]
MRWTPGGTSGDIEDRRDDGGGGGGGFPGGGRVGLGGLVVLGLLSLVFGRDFITPFLGGGPAETPASHADPARSQREQPQVQFVSFVLDDAQKTWEGIFPSLGRPYRHAKLVLFRDGVESACGMAESATGPFYCPGDEKIYI